MRTMKEWRDLIRDAKVEAAGEEGPFGIALARRLDELAVVGVDRGSLDM